MSHIENIATSKCTSLDNMSIRKNIHQPLLLVVEEQDALFSQLALICEFLDFRIERMASGDDLLAVLEDRRPVAVVTELDGPAQDGCYVLINVAAFNRHLPVMIVTGDDPALPGAVDAVEELWRLTNLRKLPALPGIGAIVEFLVHAARAAGMTNIMSA